ncbi:hypothetical protein E4T56_gene17312, partial [Termitomyces sp. T112]
SGAISDEEVAHAGEAVRMAQANLDLARSHRADAESAVGGAEAAKNPAALAAVAAVKRAANARSHMQLSSPVDGVVAQRAAQVGQQVAPGAPLMSVVPLRKVWVDANFRETQLANLRIGQTATLHSDAYGKKVTFHGKVIGLSAGSGAAFALLPAQNASGNWIKVVQRVPVRIALDPKELDAHPLRLGLSVAVTVDTSQGTGQPVTAVPAVAQASEPVDTIMSKALPPDQPDLDASDLDVNEFAIEDERAGQPQREAIMNACRERARPIVMTTVAMAAGMLPTALGIGEGSTFRQPMAIAVIGGLISSTMLSLVMVPVVYELIDTLEMRLRPRLARLITPRAPGDDDPIEPGQVTVVSATPDIA